MSDASREPGAPVEEPRPVGDVVGRAHEDLADAEAAQRTAPQRDITPAHRDITPAAHRDVSSTSRGEDIDYAMYESAADSPALSHPATGSPLATSATVGTPPERDAAPAAGDSDAPTTAYASSVPYVAPAAGAPAAGASADSPTEAYTAPPANPQPIFVQAPEPPRPRGNRAAAGLIGLLAALSFAVLYLAAALVFSLLDGTHTFETVADAAIAALTSWWLWITTAVFFLGFWLLGAIINRGRWGHWVVWGLLIGFVAYGAHLVGQLFQAPFWQLTRSEGTELIETQLVAPLAFAAFVIGRELTIWFGAWVAARGRRVSEINSEAQREYERTLEAGPTLVRSAQG